MTGGTEQNLQPGSLNSPYWYSGRAVWIITNRQRILANRYVIKTHGCHRAATLGAVIHWGYSRVISF